MTQPAAPFATLAGSLVTRLHLVVPALGIWHADATLATAQTVAGPQTLVLSGSTWACTPIRSVAFAGTTSTRLVGGAGGWRKGVPAKQYSSPAGVPTSVVLSDAALLVGELTPILDPTVPPTVGTGYVRPQDVASFVLSDLESRGALSWWMDPLGVIQTMPRPSTPITSPFAAEAVDGLTGWYRIATEFPGDWLPGATFAGPTVSGTVSRVEHRIQRGGFWSEVLVV